MNKKHNKTMSILFLSACIMVVAVKYWIDFKKMKKQGRWQQEQTTADEKTENVGKDKDDLKHTFDTVNSWLNNCDQKAGILLTVVGVAITVLVTSDFLKNLRTYIFMPFKDYWEGNHELVFSCERFIVFFLLVIAAVMLILACYYLFKTISADTDYDKLREENPELVKKSFIFYKSISEMSYEDFKKDDINYIEDLKSQIYVNSKIAINKFKNYNEGLYWFKFLLLVSVLLFIAIMFMK